MKKTCITVLRDRKATFEQYREAADLLATTLAVECSALVPKSTFQVETPLATTQGTRFNTDLILVPILRSGLIFLPSFLRCYPHARVGFIGTRRDEVTAIPELYYSKLPNLNPNQTIFLLDPMLATGGSASLAVKVLCEAGANEAHITLIAFIAAPEGVANFKKNCPKAGLIVAQVDEKLDEHYRIIPGLGDFGDRYFGNEK